MKDPYENVMIALFMIAGSLFASTWIIGFLILFICNKSIIGIAIMSPITIVWLITLYMVFIDSHIKHRKSDEIKRGN
jgi:hypothetical protein